MDPKAGKIIFAQWLEQLAAAQVWATGTKLKAEQALAIATFRDSQIRTILPSHVQAWVKGMSARLAPATVKVYDNIVSSAFRAAVTDKVIAENPCTGAKLLRERRREAAMTIPTPEQLGVGAGGRAGLVPPIHFRLRVRGTAPWRSGRFAVG